MRLISTIIFAYSVSTFSATSDYKLVDGLVPIPDSSYTGWGASDFKSAAKTAKSSETQKRFLAGANDLDDTDLSPELIAFRTKFLGAKTADELDAILVNLESNYENSPLDLQYIAAQIHVMRSMRSIVYATSGLFKAPKVLKSVGITKLKSLAKMVPIYLPTAQAQAAYDYVTLPRKESVWRFSKMDQLQAYMMTYVYKDLIDAAARLKSIYNKLPTQDKPLVVDNQLAYGPASFQDGIARYRVIDQAELTEIIGAYNTALFQIAYFCAYNMDDYLKVQEKFGKLHGIDGWIGDEMGFAAKERTAVIKSHKDYLTLRGKDGIYGQSLMKKAYFHLGEIIDSRDLTWKHVNEGGAFNPTHYVKSELWKYDEKYNFSKVKREEALALVHKKDFVPLKSLITGEVVLLNLYEFFNNSPKNLKVFLPTGFDTSEPEIPFETTKGTVKVDNYLRGRATAWNYEPFKPYLTLKTQVKPDFMNSVLRITRQSWNGELASIPFRLIVN